MMDVDTLVELASPICKAIIEGLGVEISDEEREELVRRQAARVLAEVSPGRGNRVFSLAADAISDEGADAD